MTWVFVAIAVFLVTMVWLLRRHARRFAQEMHEVGLAFVHVAVSPPDTSSQSYDVTVHGSARPYRVERIFANPDEISRVGLETPEGCTRSVALENEIEDEQDRVRVWVPAEPIVLTPGQPRRFTFRFAPDTTASTLVTISLTIPMTVGGGLTPANVRVPMRDPRAIELWNLRADLRLRAYQQGVMPNTLPEWADLLRREAELEAKGQ
jgi:hypothetical protein